jgi:hypothetical protein
MARGLRGAEEKTSAVESGRNRLVKKRLYNSYSSLDSIRLIDLKKGRWVWTCRTHGGNEKCV